MAKERKRRRRGGPGRVELGWWWWWWCGGVGGRVQEKHKAWVNTARSASGTN